LERRIRTWRALHGADRDVIFRQEHPPASLSPGRAAASVLPMRSEGPRS
jgi:hypothetical protein